MGIRLSGRLRALTASVVGRLKTLAGYRGRKAGSVELRADLSQAAQAVLGRLHSVRRAEMLLDLARKARTESPEIWARFGKHAVRPAQWLRRKAAHRQRKLAMQRASRRQNWGLA